MLDDKYELYLDYELIVQTTSAQEAISILLSLYNIFEVKFARHSRGVHLLYAIMFQDQNELTKPLRNLLVSWEYTIKNKLVVRQHLSTITATTLNNSNITQSTISMQSNENGLDVVEKVDSIQNQTINDMDQESVTNHSLNHAPALVVKENPIVISTTSKNESMHSKKQSSQPVVDENIFETIEYSSLNIEPVTKASQRPKKHSSSSDFNGELCVLNKQKQYLFLSLGSSSSDFNNSSSCGFVTDFINSSLSNFNNSSSSDFNNSSSPDFNDLSSANFMNCSSSNVNNSSSCDLMDSSSSNFNN
ncbi:unnamed protein product [Adineta steineri]|uniref:Uncharacterized protein n=1 Tax=Adineta steineri TaxID=433720 RepID=A0A819HYP2_9BILA|nr:unnamed protein product [Adineta steineri]